MRRSGIAVLSFFLSSFVFLALAQSADPLSKAGMDPERLAKIPVRMKAFVEKGTIAGAVTLVARHGVIASLEVAGYHDLETKKPMQRDTIFQVRSMTKPVTAVGIIEERDTFLAMAAAAIVD